MICSLIGYGCHIHEQTNFGSVSAIISSIQATYLRGSYISLVPVSVWQTGSRHWHEEHVVAAHPMCGSVHSSRRPPASLEGGKYQWLKMVNATDRWPAEGRSDEGHRVAYPSFAQ
ncbi:hypothetical protein DTO271G3_1677 [Paecilomyces variotii]|nr:hypothetical protein DTO271G3_1677 [Paecilomyces variotii]